MTKKLISTLLASSALALMMTTPATAQTTREILQELNALKAKVSDLENKLEKAEQKADEANKKAESGGGDWKIKWEPAPKISSADGRFEMNLRGRVLVDAGWVSNDVTGDKKATEFRAARLGIEGKAWNNVKYKFEVDFAGNEVDIKDAYVQLTTGEVKWTLGQHKTPNSLEEQTSSRHIEFMERAAFTDAFGLARQIGVSAGVGGDSWTFTVGAFRGDAGSSDMDEGTSLAARATWGPTIGENVQAHLGTSFRYRMIGDDQSLLRYRQRPFSHITGERFVNTGRLFEDDLFFGVEGAVQFGSFTLQSEYAWQWASLPGEDEHADFTGGYISANYFLTGEKRAYDPKKGKFGRPKVNNPVFNGGMGAWAIGYRYDMIDLNNTINLNGGGTFDIFGGDQNTHIVGVTWYLNRYTRMLFNYSHSKVTNSQLDASGLNDMNGNNSIDTFGIRAQVDW